MTLSLSTYAAGDTDYIAKMNADNTAIAAAVNSLDSQVRAISGATAALVPKGLQYIFDRRGIIGQDSYRPQAGTLSQHNYLLTINAGGYWDGGALVYSDTSQTVSMLGKATATYYVTIDNNGTAQLTLTAGTGTVWQFAYNSTTHEVSNVALYTNVSILFSGSDYAESLESEAFGLTFSGLAERLAEIEDRLVAMGYYFAHDPTTTSELTFGYKGGLVRNDYQVWTVTDGTISLEDDATNYVEVNPADGTVSANTTGFTSGQIPLFQVVTASGTITTVTDKRTWAAAGGGGGGGGHAQNTDVGTTSAAFTLNMDTTGVPTENCVLRVERGTAADVAMRWNEAEDKWQFTNDGTTYQDLLDASGLLAEQEFTRYVGKADPPEVLFQIDRGSSTAYEEIDLSEEITASGGCQAVVLRVFFWDSSPGAGVLVMFRGKNTGGAPATAYSVWSNQYGSATLVIPLVDELAVEYYVQASGSDTANLRVFLWGYFEKVTGVGTVHKETVRTGITVAAGSSTTVDISGCCNRGLAHYLKVTETGGVMTGTYDVEFFADDACTVPIYQATGIDLSEDYEDYLPFWLRDADNTGELHLKVTNNDTAQAGVFDVEIHYEQFA